MRAEKKTIVAQIGRVIEGRSVFILTDHTGLSSNQMNELRRLLRGSGSDYLVVKNRLLKRVLSDEMLKALGGRIAGPTAIAVFSGDCTVVSRLIADFARKNEAPRVKAGFLEGALLSAAQIGELAALPPRPELLARLAGVMQGPVGGFVRCLGELVRRFVGVMDQVARGRKE